MTKPQTRYVEQTTAIPCTEAKALRLMSSHIKLLNYESPATLARLTQCATGEYTEHHRYHP